MDGNRLSLLLVTAIVVAATPDAAASAPSAACAGLAHEARNASPLRTLSACWDTLPELALDGRTVAKLAPGARFVVDDAQLVGSARRYEAVGTASGGVTERFWSGQKLATLTARDKRWLGTALVTLLRDTGFAAEQRVAQLHAAGGAAAVLAEAERLDSDHVRATYLAALVRRATTHEDRAAILAIAADIGSDFDLRRALSVAFQIEAAPAETQLVALQAARTIGLDAEMRFLLTAAAERGLDMPTLQAFLDVADTIGSDFERRVALAAITQGPSLDARVADRCLDLIADMGSDFEQRVALTTLAPQVRDDAELARKYVAVTDRLGSFDREQALAALR